MPENIKVAVRVSPVNAHQQDERNVLEMSNGEIKIKNFEKGDETKFSLSGYYSNLNVLKEASPTDNKFIFDDIGKEALESIYLGRSSTILFYGESEFGKSSSIEGTHNKGFLQLLLSEIFLNKKIENHRQGILTEVKIAYVEIYNEKLKDLLNPHSSTLTKVPSSRASNNVSGIDPVLCESFSEALELFEDGKKIRMMESHIMNKNSLRSHTIFTIYYKEMRKEKITYSYLNIVDLAASERSSKFETAVERYQEANNIDKSIINLGIVIDILATNSIKKQTDFVPLKNSLLTQILSEGLDGTNKTFLIVTVSPEESSSESTLNILKFAEKASVVSLQKPNKLQKLGLEKESQINLEVTKNESKISNYEKELGKEIERKIEMAENRKNYFKFLGLSIGEEKNKNNFPCLVNLSDDSSMAGILIYRLKVGETKLGNSNILENDIKLNTLGIQKRHCSIFCHEGKVFIEPINGSKLFINGTIVLEKREVHNFDRITFGLLTTFKLVTSEQKENIISPILKYGQLISDKLSSKANNVKEMNRLLDNLEKRVSKNTFSKLLKKLTNIISDVDEANEYTSLSYKKFPIRERNIEYFIKMVDNFENEEVFFIVCCSHQETKEVKYIWTYEKFQVRLSEMQMWYCDIFGSASEMNYVEISPWFEASDHYIKEKEKMQNMSKKQLYDFWARKQTVNSEVNKDFILKQKEIVCKLSKNGATVELVEYYADYYFRDNEISLANIEKCKILREVEEAHGLVQKYVEFCAEIQKCNIDNKVCNDEKNKYRERKHKDPKEKEKQKETDDEFDVLTEKNCWLNSKVEELTQELRKKIKENNDLRKNKE